MNKEKLLKKVASLESLNDQLITELEYLDEIIRKVGFEEGLKSLKFAAKTLLDEEGQGL